MKNGISLRRFLFLGVVALSSLILLMGIFWERSVYNSIVVNEFEKKIRLIGELASSTCLSPLLFADRDVAQKELEALKVTPALNSAQLYASDGSLLAGFGPEIDGSRLNFIDGKVSLKKGKDVWVLVRPIQFMDQVQGAVRIEMSTVDVIENRDNVRKALVVGYLILLALCGVLVYGVMVFVSRPIGKMFDFAQLVALESRYDLRMEVTGPREFHVLAKAMNHLLEEFTKEKEQTELSQKALRESESRYSRLARKMNDTVFRYDIQTKRVTFVSNAVVEVTGYSPEEIMNQPSLLNEMVGGSFEKQVQEGLENPQKLLDATFAITHRNGETRWVHVRYMFVPGPEGPGAIEGIVSDISLRRKAEMEREELVRELKAKNTELEQFTYTVSHDLKSPLITIRGFLGLILRDAEAQDFELLKKDLGRIENAAGKMQRLLDDLLQLSRVGRLDNAPRSISFSDLAEEAENLVAGRLLERGIQIKIAPHGPIVHGDIPRLTQVMQNLLENAIKYMGDHADPEIKVGFLMRDNEMTFFVKDNGIGIAPEYHQKIFGLFEKLDAKTEGTGIGLSLVRRVIEVHGGKIWVESPGLGQGSTFFFTLPLAKAKNGG